MSLTILLLQLAQRPPNLAEWLRHQSHGIYYMDMEKIGGGGGGRGSVKRNKMTFAHQETVQMYNILLLVLLLVLLYWRLSSIKLKW